MTIDRIKLSIQTVKETIAIMESQEPDGADYYLQLEHEKFVLESLEKRIPKKPDTKITNRGIGVSGEYDIDSDYICPICKCVVGECEMEEHWFEYCPTCGQALDWSDTE